MNAGQFRLGHVPVRRLSFDEKAFDTLDERKAWLLGLLWADGMLRPNRHGYTLALTSCEHDVVAALRETLSSRHKIRIHHEPTNQHQRVCYRLELRTRKLGPRLIEMGMKHPKAARTPPDIPAELVRHFIRGYFDGDGCVYGFLAKGKPSFGVCITGYDPIISWMRIIFSDEEIVGSVQQIGPCEKFYLGKKATGKLYDYLYKDATVSLKSKQAKYERLDSGAV